MSSHLFLLAGLLPLLLLLLLKPQLLHLLPLHNQHDLANLVLVINLPPLLLLLVVLGFSAVLCATVADIGSARSGAEDCNVETVVWGEGEVVGDWLEGFDGWGEWGGHLGDALWMV